ncbi:MAG: hypothetical protein GY869_08820 [Planctomycetes bacterium]|nr:hypothetical protein [Planctomycetota bacterium]
MIIPGAFTSLPGCQNRNADPNLIAPFDRVQSALEAIPGVTIENSWLHQEDSLREFGFDVSYYQSELIRLVFPESNNLNQFTEVKLQLELEQLIKSEATWIIN